MAETPDLFSNPLATYKNAYSSNIIESFDSGSNGYGDIQTQVSQLEQIARNKETIDATVQQHLNKIDQIYEEQSANDQTVNEDAKDYFYFKKDGKLWLDYRDKKTNTRDARYKDIQTMLVQQNNTYILGMMTVASILIGTYLMIK